MNNTPQCAAWLICDVPFNISLWGTGITNQIYEIFY